MQRLANPEISPTEWRWVIIFSGLLVAATMIPYAWAFALNVGASNWQFMGMLANHQDGATYISKIDEGMRGDWLFTLSYTSEPHTGVAINEFYLFLGHISALTRIPPVLMYHIARLVTGFCMFLSLYYLGATIWARQRARRLFFSLLAVGSGLGWLAVIFHFQSLPTDLTVPESIPLFSAFTNPHFPLGIALVALLAATFVIVFRPGFDKTPTAGNGGLGVILITVALCIVQPQGWVPIAAALCLYIAVTTIRTRRIPMLELSWVTLAILPAIPFFVYYFTVQQDKNIFGIWNQQNMTPSPPLWSYMLGFGLILIIALPGLWRGIRHFERDGDRFMLIWLVANTILLYVPINLQRRLSIGLIIPIVYFAVRALEDYWFNVISPRWRDAALVTAFVFIIPSNVLSFMIPLFGVSNPNEGIKIYMLLPTDYANALHWLNTQADPNQVVLAAPVASLWIPAYSDERVVYGHPFETLYADAKRQEVQDWYNGKNCDMVSKYGVRYVFAGPLEQYIAKPDETPPTDPASMACLQTLGLTDPVVTFGTLNIYEIK